MQKIQEDESTIRAAEKKVAAADERIRDAEQEVTDTIATFGGGDSEGNGGASSEEVEKLEADLEAAHDQVVLLSDKLEELTEQMQTAQRTIHVYEQLAKVQKATSTALPSH